MRFHDLEHTLSVTRAALDIGRASGLSEQDLHLLEIAALFHDTGYSKAYQGHEAEGAAFLASQWPAIGGNARTLARAQSLIRATRMHHTPRNLLQQVIRDADSAKAGQVDFLEKAERLRLELEHVLGKRIGARAWALENTAYLEEHVFYTPYANKRFQAQKAINLRELQERSARTRAVAPKPKLLAAEPFFERDISWLAFNARVLQEAQSPTTPLLERLRFLAIHSSNLDEFYRVRVAQWQSLAGLGKRDRSALNVPAERTVARINAAALVQQRTFGTIYRDSVLPALAQEGIRFLLPNGLNKKQKAFVIDHFKQHVAPLLSAPALRAGSAPFVEDRRLYLACELQQRGAGRKKYVLLNVPSETLGRFLVLPAAKGRQELMYLDDVIRLCAPAFFKGHKVSACHAIKLSRDAELYLDEEFAGSVVDKVKHSLRKRRTGVPSRFLYDAAMPPRLLRRLKEVLGLRKSDLIAGGRYHHFSDLMDVPITGKPHLRYPKLGTLAHPALAGTRDPFARIAAGDILLHFPYQDFAAFTDLLAHAAKDPGVTHIAITLYRVARNSVVCNTLLAAMAAGKKVQVHVEVQARFDEDNNLLWGAALEKAGAQVTYGREGWKVHCKLCLFTRRESGRTRRYAYLGTGNFNERTATIYGDMALLTADKQLTADMAATFEHLRTPTAPVKTKRLILAPTAMRATLEKAIETEILHARSGKEASILLKMNSREDKPMIRKLYDASRAGVQVRLIIRGICCLVPGVKGHSEHIKAISIVDRFLEHARAMVFHNAGDPLVLLSSADWMERNMDRRIEAAFPILDPVLRAEVIDFLELQWADHTKARILDRRQRNNFRKVPKNGEALQAQTAWYERLAGKKRSRSRKPA